MSAIIDYSPLWATMKRKGITQYRLLQLGINHRILDTLKKGNNITMLTLEKLCRALDCKASDVVDFIPDTTSEKD